MGIIGIDPSSDLQADLDPVAAEAGHRDLNPPHSDRKAGSVEPHCCWPSGSGPVVARIVSRGKLGSPASDYGCLEVQSV